MPRAFPHMRNSKQQLDSSPTDFCRPKHSQWQMSVKNFRYWFIFYSDVHVY